MEHPSRRSSSRIGKPQAQAKAVWAWAVWAWEEELECYRHRCYRQRWHSDKDLKEVGESCRICPA